MSNKIFKGLAVVLALAVIGSVMLNVTGLFGFSVGLAEKYHIGDAEITQPVKNLDIDWTSGKINIAYHSGNTVLLSEKANKTLRDSERMRWQLDGDTLKIEYETPGFHLFSFHTKELTVTLPESVSLEDVRIHATSGEVNIPALQAEELTLKVTSGDIQARVNARKITGKLTSGRMELQAMEEAKEISLDATSGDIVLEAAGAEKIRIDITSGSIRAAVNKAGEIKIGSTSGDVQAVIGEAKKADISCTSGKITVDIARWEKLDVHATSGDIKAMLAAEPGFTARIDTTSGKVESKLAMAQNGKDYICGDGSAQVKLHTTSANIIVDSQKN